MVGPICCGRYRSLGLSPLGPNSVQNTLRAGRKLRQHIRKSHHDRCASRCAQTQTRFALGCKLVPEVIKITMSVDPKRMYTLSLKVVLTPNQSACGVLAFGLLFIVVSESQVKSTSP